MPLWPRDAGPWYVDGSKKWHTDPACPAIWAGGRAQLAAVTARHMSFIRCNRELRPCPCCALPAALDALSARAVTAGYHSLTCANPNHRKRCITCGTLNRYAQRLGLLATTRDGRTTLLAPGALPASYVGGAELLETHLVEWDSTISDAPTVTGDAWAAAARLLSEATCLDVALRAAAGLYTSAGCVPGERAP